MQSVRPSGGSYHIGVLSPNPRNFGKTIKTTIYANIAYLLRISKREIVAECTLNNLAASAAVF